MDSNREIGIDNIYIVHGIKGYEYREGVLKKLLAEKHGLSYRLITESADDRENNDWIDQYFISDIRNKLGKGALMCTLVHILIYKEIVENGDKYAIIFENDVCLFSNFLSKIKRIMQEAGRIEKGFIISLENSTLKFPKISTTRKGRFLYPAGIGRCAGAYIIDYQGAKNILEHLKKRRCDTVIDHWHNDLIEKDVLKMYWAHPPLTEQGSSNGMFHSSLSLNKSGLVQRIKWTSQKYYKMYILRLLRF